MSMMQMFTFGQRTIPPGWSSDIITFTGVNGTQQPGIINNYFRRYILAWTYSASEISAASGGRTTGTITGLRFFVAQQPTNQPFPSYAIGFKNGTFLANSNPGSTGYTIVKSASNESFTTNTTKTFNFSPSFSWSGGDLAITIAWGQSPTGFTSTGQSRIGSGTLHFSRSDQTGSFVINNDSASSAEINARPVVQLNFA
jgi:hypothetical protein